MKIVKRQDIEGDIPSAYTYLDARLSLAGYLQSSEQVYGDGYSRAKNDCTVQALARVLGIDYDLALYHLQDWGFGNRGIKTHRFTEALKDALRGSPDGCVFTRPRPRLSVASLLGRGTLSPRAIIGTSGHVFPVIDGIIYDFHRAVARCIAIETWEIVPWSQILPM